MQRLTTVPTRPTSDPATPTGGPATTSRRVFIGSLLALGAGSALTGCASSGSSSAALPRPAWPDDDDAWTLSSPPAAEVPVSPPPAAVGGVLSRRAWTGASPSWSRMQRMRPVRFITVHHTAGPVFLAADQAGTAARLDSIRQYHVGSLGWGDIGYHYAVDRAGRVWEARPLGWQGAHVRDHNEGNIGVVALGNFDQQEPSSAQVEAVQRHVRALMRTFRVPVARLRTHQEWAPTACPGRSMQRVMVASRASGRFG